MYCPACGTKIEDELEAHARHACPYCDAGLLEPTAGRASRL
ncbi:hypothetical protein [Haloarcula salinisoli]|nr:hypothetical protein [Halomicroarcula salinisoli]